jgi:hypothetical protein
MATGNVIHKGGSMINRISATGRIVGIKPSSNGISGTITVAVKTVYRILIRGQGENTARDNYLVFNYSGHNQTVNGTERFKKGDHVHVTGHVTSFVRSSGERPQTEIVNFYLDTIEVLRTDFEKTFGISGGHYPSDNVSLCAEGRIAGINTLNNNGLILRIDLSGGDNRNFINILVYDALAQIAKTYSIGDDICFCAQVRTLNKEERKERDWNQFRVTGLARLEKSQKAYSKSMSAKNSEVESPVSGTMPSIYSLQKQNESQQPV